MAVAWCVISAALCRLRADIGGLQLDDATVIGALRGAAPSENFGGPPPERPLHIVQPLGGAALRDVFGAFVVEAARNLCCSS